MTHGHTLPPVPNHDVLTAWKAWLIAADLSPQTIRLRPANLASW